MHSDQAVGPSLLRKGISPGMCKTLPLNNFNWSSMSLTKELGLVLT
jgi:hypothetical protein